MGALVKAGVFKPIKKTVKLTSSRKAVAAILVKMARPTVGEKGSILTNGPGGRFTLT